LLARHIGANQSETVLAYNSDGQRIESITVPFARSLAATVVSMQEPCVINRFETGVMGPLELQPFEMNRSNLIAAPMTVAPGIQVVLELFDKAGDFSDEDRHVMASAGEFGTELIRQAMAERQTRRTLFDAVETALRTSSSLQERFPGAEVNQPENQLPQEVMDQLRQGFSASGNAVVDADTTLELAEVVRELALRHGAATVKYCIRMARNLCELLDNVTGAADG
jgi:uncharacterized protein (DUF2267 family)